LFFSQIGEDCGQVALNLEGWAGGLLKAYVHFVGDDGGQGGLAQAGRAEEEDVIERLATGFGGFEGDGELLFGFGLADEFAEPAGAQLELEAVFFAGAYGAYEPLGIVFGFQSHAVGSLAGAGRTGNVPGGSCPFREGDYSSDDLVVKAFEGLAEAHGEKRLAGSTASEQGVWIDAGTEQVELVEPYGVCDGEVVADAASVPCSKKCAILPLTRLITNPPPEVVWLDECDGTLDGGALCSAVVDTVAAILQHEWVFGHMVNEFADMMGLIEAVNETEWLGI
jgi:hypothetical protein